MGNRHHEPERPGSRAEGRRRQFEDSRGLTDPRDLPLDDESAAGEPESETEADDPGEASSAESQSDEDE